MSKNTDIVRRGYAAFAMGDMKTLTEVIDADCVWEVPGQNSISGTYRGRDAVFSYFIALATKSGGSFVVELQDCFDFGEDRVIVKSRATGSVDRRELDTTGLQLFELRNGQVVGVTDYVRDQQALDAFFPAVITLPKESRSKQSTR